MSRAIGVFRAWTSSSRYAIELMAPSSYLTRPYYEKWFLRNQNLLIERGLIDADEVAVGRALRPAKNLTRGPFTLADVEQRLQNVVHTVGRRPRRRSSKSATRVRTKNIHPTTHTRLPRYARGHVGVVERLHGAHIFPDSAAAGKGEDPQWLYTVRFHAQELWGADADPKLKVSVEAFEPYLEHV